MMRVLVHVHDDAGWEESKHPREKNGQFAKYNTGSAMHEALTQHGFSKQKQKPGQVLEYHHPEGHKVYIGVPQSGKKQSSQFMLHHAKTGGKVEGTGSASFMSAMKSQSKLAPPPKLEQAPPVSAAPKSGASYMTNHSFLQSQGFKPDSQGYYVKGGTKVVLKSGGGWTLYTPSGAMHEGTGASALGATIAEHVKEPEKKDTTERAKIHMSLLGQGYTESKADNGDLVLTKGNSKVEVKEDGTWTSTSPGHLPKTGVGVESLKALLEGKPGAYKNTSGVISGFEEQKSSHAEAQKKFNELSKHAPTPTEKEHNAIKQYTGNSYRDINDCMRHQVHCADHRVAPINEYLKRAKIPEDMTVYRGVKGEYAKVLKSIITEGTVFKDKGFLSTSIRKDVGKNFSGGLLLEIKVKAGTHGAAVGHLGQHHGEHEVLFPTGTHLKVTSYDETSGHVVVELVQ